jgi:hypothetical protein
MPGVELPPDPRFGMTNACITERGEPGADPASRFTVITVSAASAIGSGCSVSGALGTADRTVAVVAESRKSSLR